MSVVTTPAVLLRAYNYSETSQVLRFYTRDHGVVGVMAKGVRRSSGKGGTGLETFASGPLTFRHKATRDLQTLQEFAPERAHRALAAHIARFAGASVLAELVLENAGSDGNPMIFDGVLEALAAIETEPEDTLVARILVESWGVVEALGYAPQIDLCVHCEEPLTDTDLGRFDFRAGGVRCPSCAEEIEGPLVGPGARAELETLLQGRVPEGLRKPRAQLRLLEEFVVYHVSEGRPLQSFAFLTSLPLVMGDGE